MPRDSFQGTDFYRTESLLSEEEIQVRNAVRSWVSRRFLPIVNDHVRAGTFPLDLVPEMAEMGMFGANLQGYGCAGLNNVAYGLIMQELERGDSGLRSFASVQGSLVMYPIHTWGSCRAWRAARPLAPTASPRPITAPIRGRSARRRCGRARATG
jgi:glutaryl-CoA dehydrogenase